MIDAKRPGEPPVGWPGLRKKLDLALAMNDEGLQCASSIAEPVGFVNELMKSRNGLPIFRTFREVGARWRFLA